MNTKITAPVHLKALTIVEFNQRSIVMSGSFASEFSLKSGYWVYARSVTYVAQSCGYINPVISWKVNGVPVSENEKSVIVPSDGKNYEIDISIHNDDRTLELTSKPGDVYKIEVTAELTDDEYNLNYAKAVFEVVDRASKAGPFSK